MKVTNIDIADLHYSGTTQRHQGYVSMQLRPEKKGMALEVHFLCHAQQPRDCPASLVTRDLIQDALRQAHRMPGFRRGEQTIDLEISVAPIAPRAASA